MHGKDYPTQIGNVVYLSGEPPQSSLEAIFKQAIGDIDLDAAIERFSTALMHAGRPGQRVNITTNLGPRIIDLILSGHTVSRVPWHNCCWYKEQSASLPIFEVQGSWEGRGWWAQVKENVLLHAPFSGISGLDSHQASCLLSESPTPHSALLHWFNDQLKNPDGVDYEDVCDAIPNNLQEHLGWSFKQKKRKATIYTTSDEASPLFIVRESER